uniref:Calcineurin-like phosphoesterase domain-containing protein n=1 Tax=Eiseniibacteriota bacterium TaxID=2212470 RepID=A0A832I4I0_UNCEI
MAVATFLQVSDLHLGRPFTWLPAEKRAERRADQRRALERAVREAIERGVHAILVPGDLFDAEEVDADTLAFALAAFDVAGCPPVFIAPGNHDPWSEASPLWSPRLLAARGWAWPAHVHVFSRPAWQPVPLPGHEEVHVWGRCFTPGMASTERPLAEGSVILPASADAQGLDLCVFHGSLEGACPPSQKVTGPFSEKEVTHSPFGYHAVGHYHVPSRLEHRQGALTSTSARGTSGVASAGVRLAYAGSAVALDLTETGAHGALEVRIEYGRRQPFVEVQPVQLDRRTTWSLEANVNGASSAELVDRRIARVLDEAGVREHDLVRVRVTGRLARGVRWSGAGPEVQKRAFFVKLDLRGVRPDYDLDAYRASDGATTEERFARTLLERIGAEGNAEERAVLERALYYGLDAFRLREVVPAYEELGE